MVAALQGKANRSCEFNRRFSLPQILPMQPWRLLAHGPHYGHWPKLRLEHLAVDLAGTAPAEGRLMR